MILNARRRPLCALPLLCSVLLGQPQKPSEPPAVVIRSTTRLVQVNVVVRDRNGNAVTGLTRDDFVLEDDGKPQDIRVFAFQPSEKPARPTARPAPGVSSNRYVERAAIGVTAILLDGLNTSWGDQAATRQQVVRYLQNVRPEDRIALYTLGRELRILHDYTSEPSALLKALSAYTGRHSPELDASHQPMIEEIAQSVAAEYGNTKEAQIAMEALQGVVNTLKEEEFFYKEQRVLRTFKALEAIANHLAGVPGRKNLIWISAAFPLQLGYFESPDAERGPSPESSDSPFSAKYPGRRRTPADRGALLVKHGRSRTFGDEFQRAARALSTANLSVYPIDARGLSPNPRAFENIATMNDLAHYTGGKAYRNTNDIMGSIREAVQDAEVSYTLAYYPNESNLDGRFRRIKVKVRRPSVSLRHRLGYYDLAEPSPGKASDAAVRDALWSPMDATAVPMDAQLKQAEAAQAFALEVTIDPSGVTFQPKNDRWTADLQFFLAQTGEEGREHGITSQTVHLELLPGIYENVRRDGYILRESMNRSPGATSLRVLVRDVPSGNIGRVIVPFDAPPH